MEYTLTESSAQGNRKGSVQLACCLWLEQVFKMFQDIQVGKKNIPYSAKMKSEICLMLGRK